MQCGQLNIFVKCEMMEKCEEFDFIMNLGKTAVPLKNINSSGHS